MRVVRTEVSEDEVIDRNNEEEEEEHISLKKVLIVIALFTFTVILGFATFLFFDYIDNREQQKDAHNKIDSMNVILNNQAAISIVTLEDIDFDLNQLKSDLSINKVLSKDIESTMSLLTNHLALVPNGTYINSWATSKQVRAEIDTLRVPFKDRNQYALKTVYIPVTATESRAFDLLKNHPVWGKDECISIASGKVWVGMNKEQLILSKGQPKHVDKTNSSSIISEQWAYGNTGPFYYLENGILVSWQD